MATNPSYVVSATARLKADPRRVYGTIANYHTGHPRIVPKQFSDLTVVKGGVGAGTEITFKVTVLGQTTKFRAVVSEPEPGRMLVERNLEGNDGVTTFIVDAAGNDESNVTIRTEAQTRPGLAGRIEAWISARILPSMYREELRRLESVASQPH